MANCPDLSFSWSLLRVIAINHIQYSHCHGITKSHLVFHLFRVFSLPSQKWNTSCVCQGEGVIYTVFSDLVLKITKAVANSKVTKLFASPTIFGHFLITSSIPHHQQASSLTQFSLLSRLATASETTGDVKEQRRGYWWKNQHHILLKEEVVDEIVGIAMGCDS